MSEATATKEPMDAVLRARLVERLSHRAARLAQTTQASHPASKIDGVIALMAGHVARTAMILLGETFAREMWRHIFDDFSEGMGVCRFCHARPLRDDRTMCQVCWDDASSDDEITDEELGFVAVEANEASIGEVQEATSPISSVKQTGKP